MKNNITEKRQFLINRLGYLRNRANLSARELSGRIDKSFAYFAKFENGDFNIPSENLLEAIECCGSTAEEFFWEDITKFSEEKEILNLYNELSNESKQTIKELLKNMK
ncbi:MAG: helix-turn-helix transcriptional regulator [Clostridia bacterium]|nr:helix-turn-helix transcriptional regulator [Clostridia bacterium]